MSQSVNFSTKQITAYLPAVLKHNANNWLVEFYRGEIEKYN